MWSHGFYIEQICTRQHILHVFLHMLTLSDFPVRVRYSEIKDFKNVFPIVAVNWQFTKSKKQQNNQTKDGVVKSFDK